MKVTLSEREAEVPSCKWIAYQTECPGKWEKGRTRAEALGNLIFTHPDTVGSRLEIKFMPLSEAAE